MVCNDPEAEQEVLPGENNRSTGMDSTVLHWVLRVQELNGVVQDRTTDLQSCELRLSELHQELERHLEQQTLLEDSALRLHLKTAELQCAVRTLQTKLTAVQKQLAVQPRQRPENSASSARKQQLLLKIQKERSEMHSFVHLMRSFKKDKQQATATIAASVKKVQEHSQLLTRHQMAYAHSLWRMQAQQQDVGNQVACLQDRTAQMQSCHSKLQAQISMLQKKWTEELGQVQRQVAGEKRSLNAAVAQEESLKKRLCNELRMNRELSTKQKELQIALQSAKKAMLELSA